MNKVFTALIFTSFVSSIAFTQNKPIRPRALGISYIINDFATAEQIRTRTLSTVLREKQWSKFKDMSPGLALTYFKGMTPHIDFAGSFAFSSSNNSLHNNSTGDALFLEGDASANFKMFDESYWITPYFSAGIGASKFHSYYAAFLPLGLGFKVNLFDEAAFFLATRYHISVTEAASYHFMYCFGISGVIGK
jgi:hypothetical protein